MKKIKAWIGGILIGAIITYLLFFYQNSSQNREYKLVAVSWGTHINQSKWIYQIQVLAEDRNKDGVLEISAKAWNTSSWLGGHDFGILGTASDMGHAVRDYGTITWEPDKVTIGGSNGIKTSIGRKLLSKY